MFANIETLHWIIAYCGLLIYTLMKLAELPGSLLEGFTKKDILTTIASIVAIPVILVICTDTSIKEMLPINYLTSFLAGWQTQSFIRTFSMLGGKMVTNKPKAEINN